MIIPYYDVIIHFELPNILVISFPTRVSSYHVADSNLLNKILIMTAIRFFVLCNIDSLIFKCT
jgi:hypothetical protein